MGCHSRRSPCGYTLRVSAFGLNEISPERISSLLFRSVSISPETQLLKHLAQDFDYLHEAGPNNSASPTYRLHYSH